MTRFEEEVVSHSAKRQNLRNHFRGGTCFQPASVFDPISARLADSLGFGIAIFPGSSASAVVLGAPDIALLSINDLVDQTRRITRVSNLSLIVDADNGYGNSINVIAAIRDLEAAGASAITIEDTVLPQIKGTKGEHLIELDELLSKTTAALEARVDPETIIIGRTHALRTGGAVEAERRVKALASSGVDAIFLVGVNNEDDLKDIYNSSNGLPILLGGSEVMLTETELASYNVSIIIRGHQTFQASVQGIYSVLLAQLNGELQSYPVSNLASTEVMDMAIGKNYYRSLSNKFLD